MNPILLGRQVERSLKDLVRGTFNTTGPAFDGTIDRFLAAPSNFLKGPWISVAMPFKQLVAPGATFDQPFPDVPLRFAPYQHQLTAFERLGGANPRSTLVATGTGSGKTESYLWPILEHCRLNKDKPGIKAILIYPMNALATDQARRIARAIDQIPALTGVRAGIYADAEPSSPTDAMMPHDVITRRSAMWDNPPDILLTNYKMLDYLLLRGRDQPLWSKNTPETMRFLVVDEMHTFDGAQGADLALLIRRLKHRLATPEKHLVCVGSSATLGSGDEAAADLRSYAETIFGETFDADAVVRETRQSPDDVLPTPEYVDWPSTTEVDAALEKSMGLSQAEAASELVRCLFPSPTDPELEALHNGDPSNPEWRLLLGKLSKEHLAVQRVLRILAASRGPMALEKIAEELRKVKALAGWEPDACKRLAELIVSLLAWARSGGETAIQPLFGVRIQTWVREMSRMVATLPRPASAIGQSEINLIHAHDLDRGHLKSVLPLVNCTRCGTAAHLGRQAPKGNSLWAPLEDLYEDFFDGNSSRLRLIYHEPVSRKAGTSGHGQVVTGFIDTGSLEFTPGDHRDVPDEGHQTAVWIYDPTNDAGRIDRTCPACGHDHGLLLFGLRASRLTAALANTLYVSQHNEEKPEAKPRFLMFSDSVQDAAQRAAVAEIRNTSSVVRKSLHNALTASTTGGLTLSEIISDVPEDLRQALGDEAFVATFIARGQTWRQPYQDLVATDRLPSGGKRFLDHVKLRLGWEYFSDLTYRSHTSQTLEASGIAIADVAPELIAALAEKLPRHLAHALGGSFTMDEVAATRFLSGFLQQMRRRGAVGHPYIVTGMETAALKRGGPNYFAAAKQMGLGNTETLPVPNHQSGVAPRPVTLRSSINGYQSLLRDHSTNWYRDWADKFFVPISMSLVSQYDTIFETTLRWLEAEHIIRRIDRPAPSYEHGYVIEPSAITVSDRVQHLSCNTCRRREIALSDNKSAVGAPCTQIACRGVLVEAGWVANTSTANAMSTDRNHRVVGREHTGILESDERRAIETSFIEKEVPWAPNLISATPTLEMGIDIGDLSTLLLCSVPPEEANYVQRIGRSGRRDGNSLNLTMAMARPHDLQFWEDPDSMLSGEVRAPGVFVGALSVLLRQVAAFTLDCLIASGARSDDYGKVKNVLRQLAEDRGAGFPLDWFDFIDTNSSDLADRFLDLLPEAISGRPDVRDRIQAYLTGNDHHSLIWHIRSVFDEAAAEREELVVLRKELDAEAKRVKRRESEMTEEELNKRLSEIKSDKGEINHAIRNGIDEVSVLRFLTDKGVLPNYAFPEEGVKLKSILARQTEDGKRVQNGDNLVTREYVRPASSALSELALGQTFYADGREVTIDRLDLNKQDLSSWRFCQNCSHVEKQATAKNSKSCPRCGDDMWDDSGSTHEAIELKTVIAVTKEQTAAIRDADDRQQKIYDRSMLPFYDPKDIGASWYAEGESGSVPFGFEFLPSCTFRDFNFGTRASGPFGPKIAGQARSSRPFQVCRHCGIAQKPPRGADDPGQHQPRCQVLQQDDKHSPEEWEAEVFLLRKFDTESIRMVVPVVGDASNDDIKSFVAAINLGMREHFAGKVDHIRSTVVEVQLDGVAFVRSLFLYDAVPGGSGYLRQLSEHPATMRSIVEKAAHALKNCSCVAQGKTGCFRCVKPYRSQFGPGEPDRDTALHMMEEILANWENLTRTDAGIDTRIRDFLVESQLEKRFLEFLEKRFGAGSIQPKVLEGGRKGFQLRVQRDTKTHFWTIETQVQIDKRYRDVPTKRVDFVLKPVGSRDAKPIIVELDGLQYHADTVAEDLATRILLIRSGHVRVWTLGWNDLGDQHDSNIPTPLSEARLGPQHAGVMAKVLARAEFSGLDDEITLIQQGSSFEGLVRYLERPTMDISGAISVLNRTIVGKGQELDALPQINDLADDSRSFLEESKQHGFVTESTLDVYFGNDAASLGEWRQKIDDCRVLLRGNLPNVTGDAKETPAFSSAWRGLWRLVNLFQDLPGFHVEFEGLDTLSAPDVHSTKTAPQDGAWLEVFTLTDELFHPLLQAIQAAGIPAPDLIGADLTVDGAVAGMAEVGWSEKYLAVCETPFELKGWSLIHFDPESGQSLTELTASILRHLEEK
ncbi:MAG: DEAD/DEAH box helicase [Roseibium sp.]|uniref:DEAD/DEAH box helicase n=1 Tax=Roseibium polysiphoniae TaxID=2571221 RepID=UPI0032982882